MSGQIDETLCRWAEAKYGLSGVTRVQFEPGAHGPYSDVTPDVDPYLRVEVSLADGSFREFEEDYATKLIRELVEFSGRPRGATNREELSSRCPR